MFSSRPAARRAARLRAAVGWASSATTEIYYTKTYVDTWIRGVSTYPNRGRYRESSTPPRRRSDKTGKQRRTLANHLLAQGWEPDWPSPASRTCFPAAGRIVVVFSSTSPRSSLPSADDNEQEHDEAMRGDFGKHQGRGLCHGNQTDKDLHAKHSQTSRATRKHDGVARLPSHKLPCLPQRMQQQS